MSLTTIAIGAVVVLGLFALVAAAAAGGKKPADEFGRFTRKPLLNKSEKKLVLALDAVVPDAFGSGARILSQVSYGEFLKGEGQAARARINQKRADFVIVDADFEILCVIEYQGAGHYGRGEKARENAELRDRVKRAACASAGIPLVEVPAKFSEEVLLDLLKASQSEDAAA